jgi:hypothetical protein
MIAIECDRRFESDFWTYGLIKPFSIPFCSIGGPNFVGNYSKQGLENTAHCNLKFDKSNNCIFFCFLAITAAREEAFISKLLRLKSHQIINLILNLRWFVINIKLADNEDSLCFVFRSKEVFSEDL